MPVVAPTAFAALEDFLRGGLAGDALKTAPCDLGPVTVTGAGTGSVTPYGALDVGALHATSATFDVLIVAGGALGTATYQWRIHGRSYGAVATTPSDATLLAPLGLGLLATFDGTLTTGDVWSFPAVSCIQQALDAWNARMDAAYRKRLGASPANWDALIVQRVVDAARKQVLTVRGFNPENSGDMAVVGAGARAEAWFDAADAGTAPLPGDTSVPGSFGGTFHEAVPTFQWETDRRRGFSGF